MYYVLSVGNITELFHLDFLIHYIHLFQSLYFCCYFIPRTILNRPVLYIFVDNLMCFVLKIAN